MVVRDARVILVPCPRNVSQGEWDETDPEVRRYREEAAMSPFRETTDRRRRQLFLVQTRSGRLLGQAELADIRRGEGVAELRICLYAKGARGRGFGREAVLELLRYACFRLSLRKVYLRVYADNDRAVACYRKCLFKVLGRVERRDGDRRATVLLMGRDLGAAPAPQKVVWRASSARRSSTAPRTEVQSI